MSKLDEVLLKIKRGDVNCLSYDVMANDPIISMEAMADPRIAYLCGIEQAKMGCGEMIAKAQKGLNVQAYFLQQLLIKKQYMEILEFKKMIAAITEDADIQRVENITVSCITEIAVKQLREENEQLKEQLASTPDESSLVKACRCIVSYCGDKLANASVIKIRPDIYHNMWKALDGYPIPQNFFPECRHRSMEGTVAKCGYEKGEHYGKPCSKRCLTPDQHTIAKKPDGFRCTIDTTGCEGCAGDGSCIEQKSREDANNGF